MNPFSSSLPPAPKGATGKRGYATQAEAKAAALGNPDVRSYAVMRSPQGEFAWVAPQETFMTRMALAIKVGIHLVELGERRHETV